MYTCTCPLCELRQEMAQARADSSLKNNEQSVFYHHLIDSFLLWKESIRRWLIGILERRKVKG